LKFLSKGGKPRNANKKHNNDKDVHNFKRV